MAQRGSWMRLTCGAQVYDIADPRHVGTVVAIRHGAWVTVRWPNGWISIVPLHALRKAAP